MERLNRDTNLLEISVNKYDDLLVIDCGDLSVFEKFAELSSRVDALAEDAGKELERVNSRHEGEDQASAELVRDYVGVNIGFSKKVLAELDGIFGDGFTDKAFRENYEVNPDFVPDEIAPAELVEALVPVMEKAYGERIRRNKSKYSATKRGKHTAVE